MRSDQHHSEAINAKLTFHGAALEVTGSCHLLEANDHRMLLDCGMLQGASATKKVDGKEFDFSPSSIDMVILSHAHLDHSGALPKLVAAGFNGPIYCASGTRKLLRVLLEDSHYLYIQDLKRQNQRRRRKGLKPAEASYSARDVETVLTLCQCFDYYESQQIAPGVDLCFHNAGHILGSAIVEVTISRNGQSKTLVFSGDLGNADTALMPDPDNIESADVVLLESTYGDRNHRSKLDTLAEFKQIIKDAEEHDGNILIPSFAVGRTQELLFQLGHMYQQGELKNWRVYLDSPMASAVTDIYDACIHQLDRKDTDIMKSNGSMRLQEFLPCLTVSQTVDDSMLINETKSRAIIIAGSGMCTGGRIRHHFRQRIAQNNTHIIFVGFQAEGTFGRKLIDGEKHVKLYKQELKVRAQIHTIGGFSAHAGQDELIEWVQAINGSPKVVLVHGEQKAVVALHEQLLSRANIDALIAVKGASANL